MLIPPMGYFKDKNTGEVVIIEEQAAIVRRIFDLYLSGYGIKAIAKILNAEGIKSQGYYQQKLLGKKLGDNKPEIARRFLWENTGVKRVLQNEFYCGTVRYEYTCNGYHRYGKENCTSHRIDESQLDKLIFDELLSIKEEAEAVHQHRPQSRLLQSPRPLR